MSDASTTSDAHAAPLLRRLEISALWSLFFLTLRQQLHGKRLFVLGCVYLLPIGLVLLVRAVETHHRAAGDEMAVLFTLIPHTLVPLTALLCATGMIHDELEEQTLTYLLVRPLPKWGIYLAKFTAITLLTMAISTIFTVLSYLVVYWGEPNLWSEIAPRRSLAVSGITCLALVTYCSIFGCLSFLTRWPLVVGIGYIALLEGMMANIDFAARRLTVNYYFRVLIQEWVGRTEPAWRLDPAVVPSASSCVTTLLLAALVATVPAVYIFSNREFRVKTPAGN